MLIRPGSTYIRPLKTETSFDNFHYQNFGPNILNARLIPINTTAPPHLNIYNVNQYMVPNTQPINYIQRQQHQLLLQNNNQQFPPMPQLFENKHIMSPQNSLMTQYNHNIIHTNNIYPQQQIPNFSFRPRNYENQLRPRMKFPSPDNH